VQKFKTHVWEVHDVLNETANSFEKEILGINLRIDKTLKLHHQDMRTDNIIGRLVVADQALKARGRRGILLLGSYRQL
tara:strand:- start:1664 stop:1897 length:234 start_codon:yes stop_codon:yes gene_type:complete